MKVTGNGTNKTFWIQSPLSQQFKPDQSVAHNGVCLTVEATAEGGHRVTAISETLQKTALNSWETGSVINLERSLQLSGRMDGHFVQGHVDATGRCERIENKEGSFEITFSFPQNFAPLIIEKGSICVNGISLTAFHVTDTLFTVGIIPYTWQHTNLRLLKEGGLVNLEFDMIGKYILRKMGLNP